MGQVLPRSIGLKIKEGKPLSDADVYALAITTRSKVRWLWCLAILEERKEGE